MAWFELKHHGKSVPGPILVLDAYLVGAPPFMSKAQRDLVGDCYHGNVSIDRELADAVTGAAKAFVLIGDLNVSAVGMAWQKIIPFSWSRGTTWSSTSPRNRRRPAGLLRWPTPSRHHRWIDASD